MVSTNIKHITSAQRRKFFLCWAINFKHIPFCDTYFSNTKVGKNVANFFCWNWNEFPVGYINPLISFYEVEKKKKLYPIIYPHKQVLYFRFLFFLVLISYIQYKTAVCKRLTVGIRVWESFYSLRTSF